MDRKIYRKTRYQNIYMNIKNRNYIIEMSNPKTTLSKIDNKKIYDLSKAVEFRNKLLDEVKKGNFQTFSDAFGTLYDKYLIACKNDLKLAYNTLNKKVLTYNKYLSQLNKYKLTAINKELLTQFISKQDTTDKQKNRMIRELKAFYNWCIKNEITYVNPAATLTRFKEERPQMKYWLPEDLKNILNTLNEYIEKGYSSAYTIKALIVIGFSLGDRVGETRALRFGDIDFNLKQIRIAHSINYDTKSKDFLSSTKTYASQRTIPVSDNLLNEIKNYKEYLQNKICYNVTDDTLIFINPRTNKPYSDAALRKEFNYYIEKSGVPKIRMYDLRHTFATTMMTEGWDMYAISNRLGHTNIQTTINVYGHITEEVKKRMAETTDKYI